MIKIQYPAQFPVNYLSYPVMPSHVRFSVSLLIAKLSLIVSSFSPHNLHLLCYCVLSIFALFKIGQYVTLCRWPAKQTIPLSVLARNQTNFDLKSRRDRKWKGTREKRSWRAVGEGRRTRAVNSGQRSREASRHERGSSDSEEDRVKMSRHRCCFVEVSLVTHASVNLHMLKVLHNSPSALELTPSVCSFVLFSPVPSMVFDVVVKKCALPLSEPLVDHRL